MIHQCQKCKKFCSSLVVVCRLCSGMTVRATWTDGRIMYFGDSYKKWEEQLKEYVREYMDCLKPLKIEESYTPWIKNGAKWRNEELFLKALEAEHRTINEFNFLEYKQ